MALNITATGPQTHHARDALVRDLWRQGAGEIRIARELGISRRSARRRMERVDLEIGVKARPEGQEAQTVDGKRIQKRPGLTNDADRLDC